MVYLFLGMAVAMLSVFGVQECNLLTLCSYR